MKIQRQVFEVIVPTNIKPLPDKYEMAVARILAQKFQSNIKFVVGILLIINASFYFINEKSAVVTFHYAPARRQVITLIIP